MACVLKKTDIDTGPGSCFYHQVGKCEGACIGIETPDSYNDRVRKAVAATHKNLDEDFVIADRGRAPGEVSLVLVSKGKVMGWGYVDEDHSISGFNDDIHHIDISSVVP